MFHRFPGPLRARHFLLPLGVIAALGLSGCFRSHGHDGSPERVEKFMTYIEEEVAEDLELREEQRPGYDAFTARIKDQVRRMADTWRDTKPELRTAIEAEQPDIDRVAELFKASLRGRPTPAEVDSLIDAGAAFYKTLDPEQQEQVREHLARKLRRHS